MFVEALAGRGEAACREACLAMRDLTYQNHVESRFVLRAVLGVVKHRAGRRPETVRAAIAAMPFVTPLPRDAVVILADALQDAAPAVAFRARSLDILPSRPPISVISFLVMEKLLLFLLD